MDLKDFGTRFEAALVELLTLQDEFFKLGEIEKSPSEIKIQDDMEKIEFYFSRRGTGKEGRPIEKCKAGLTAFYNYSEKKYQEIKMQAGAIVCKDMTESFQKTVWKKTGEGKAIYKLRFKLEHEEKLIKWEKDGDYFILKEDHPFDSASAAASFVLGCSSSGGEWLGVNTNKTLNEIKKELIESDGIGK